MNPKSPTFEFINDKCLFCDPSQHGQGKQILLKSDNFYLFAPLGAIVEGYIIIAPYRCKDHGSRLRSLSDVPFELIDELSFLRALVSNFYRYRFDKPGMSFEHGRAGGCMTDNTGTQHCYHAHLCCYPVNYRLWEDLTEFQTIEVEGLHDIKKAAGKSPYLYLETVETDKSKPEDNAERESWYARIVVIGDETRLESQYLRKLLATRVRQPEIWDWEKYPRIEFAEQLVIQFREWLHKTKEYSIRWNILPRLNFIKSVVQSNQVGNDYASSRYSTLWVGQEQYGAIGQFLRQFKDNLEERPYVLDIGCGPGTYLKVFYDLGIEAIGIDISDDMLEIARVIVGRKSSSQNIKRPTKTPKLKKMNALELKFPAGSFDGIWCSALLVHLPRAKAPSVLSALHRILKDDGVIYLSAQIGGGCQVRWEGRVFFYYSKDELQYLFHNAGFEVIQSWSGTAKKGSLGCSKVKNWRHYILKKIRSPRGTMNKNQESAYYLSDLGERGILERIVKSIPLNYSEQVVLGIGDDCTVLRSVPEELIIVTIDPCPEPVISLLGSDDPWYKGWFSVTINLSDLAAMGARPLGILLSIEAREDMTIYDFDRFYEGVTAATKTYNCPVVGGNIKDASKFNCVGTAIGAVRAEQVLRRDAAQPDELVVVLGEMGRFWAGVIHRLEAIPLEPLESELLLENLRQPRPRLREGCELAEKALSRCAIDSSDGLTACFYEIARSGNKIDVHLDLTDTVPDPLVQKIAHITNIDVRKLMLSWGNWELVCTVRKENLKALKKVMEKLDCPVSVVGWISQGKGYVWLHEKNRTGRLNYFASERFTKQSYFTYGLSAYLRDLRKSPIINPI